MKKSTADRWRETLEALAKYRAARNEAQRLADADGFDRGIEANDLFKDYRVFMLPRKENRYGHERSCEVVSCSSLDRTQVGHGYR